MARVRGDNIRVTDAQKNVEGDIILQNKAGTTAYKLVGWTMC
jgi:hypothetical protein